MELEAVSTAVRNLSLSSHTLHVSDKSGNNMIVEINKRRVEVGDDITTLGQLLERENLAGPGRAAAIDNKLAPRPQWNDIMLSEGMNITVIRAVCGG